MARTRDYPPKIDNTVWTAHIADYVSQSDTVSQSIASPLSIDGTLSGNVVGKIVTEGGLVITPPSGQGTGVTISSTVTWIRKEGETPLYNTVTFAEGTDVGIDQVDNTLTINFTGTIDWSELTGIPDLVNYITIGGSSLNGTVDLVGGTNIDIAIAGQTVTFSTTFSAKTASYIVHYDYDNNKYIAVSGDNGTIVYGGLGDQGGIDGDLASDVINACIGALNNGGKIAFQADTFTLADTITLTDNVTLEGEGRQATVLKADAGFSGTLIYASDPTWYPVIRDMTLDGSDVTDTLIHLYAGLPTLENLVIEHSKSTTDGRAIKLNNPTGGTAMGQIRNIYMRLIGHDGLYLAAADCIVDGLQLNTAGGIGIIVTAGDSKITDTHIFYCDEDAIYIWSAGVRARISGCYLENSIQRNLRAGDASDLSIINTVFGHMTDLTGTLNTYENIQLTRCDGTEIIGCQFRDQYGRVQENIDIVESNGVRVITNTFEPPNASGAGIKVSSNSSFTVIKNNYMVDHGTVIADYGVQSIVKDNIFDNCSTIFSALGTDIDISGNRGYVTENSGTLSLDTTEWFAHGLATTPTHVNITPKGTIVGVGYDATDSSIQLLHSGGESITFSWEAEV